jgi:Domain of unknown function (DUF6468)
VSSNSLGMTIESLVAILLIITIAYCVLLNRRLKMLKSDEQSLKATISELVTATEIAERAIGGLKETVREGDTTLGERLRGAERTSIGLDLQIAAGKDILGRVQKIVDAARTYEETLKAQRQLLQIRPVEPEFLLGDDPAPPAPPQQRQSAKSVAAAAQAFAERLRTRVHGLAA